MKKAPRHIGASSGLARRYARAFIDYAETQSDVESSVQDAARFSTLLLEDAQLRRFMKDKSIKNSESIKAVNGLLDLMNANDVLRRFVGVVAKNRRLNILQEIFESIAELDLARRGTVVAEVCSAIALTNAQRDILRARLTQAGHDHVEIFESIKPDLIGGLTIKIGAQFFDSSISGRLTRLQFAMKGAA